jgi:hypothetical protein
MKKLIFITIAFVGLITAGCSTTTYLSLTENNKEQIEDKLGYDEQDENVGAGVTLLLKDKTEIKGELLYVQDSTLTICTEHSAKEEELVSYTYPINKVLNDEIQELTIEGSNYLWTGVGYGAAGGAVLLGIIVYATTPEDKNSGGTYSLNKGIFSKEGQTVMAVIVGALLGAIAGGVIGAISNDDLILQDIPPGYDFSLLKPLARYSKEEPEYLRAIK